MDSPGTLKKTKKNISIFGTCKKKKKEKKKLKKNHILSIRNCSTFYNKV